MKKPKKPFCESLAKASLVASDIDIQVIDAALAIVPNSVSVVLVHPYAYCVACDTLRRKRAVFAVPPGQGEPGVVCVSILGAWPVPVGTWAALAYVTTDAMEEGVRIQSGEWHVIHVW